MVNFSNLLHFSNVLIIDFIWAFLVETISTDIKDSMPLNM